MQDFDAEGMTIAYDAQAEEDMIVSPEAEGIEYVTGWLVCTAGPEKGRDYRIYHGFNYAGRSPQMDIRIMDDEEISPEGHFAIVYEQKQNRFYLAPVKSNITYYQGELLAKPQEIETGAVIQAGNSTFAFMAFCRKDFIWEKE